MMKKVTAKARKNRICDRALLKKIRVYPDPVLRSTCKKVKDVLGEETMAIVDLMTKVLTATKNGVGIAANQLGFTKRIIALRPARHNVIVMINPKITWKSKETYGQFESCLSYPGRRGKVDRPMAIVVEYIDREGVKNVMEGTFWIARIIQHEVDHLNGKCKLQ